MVFLVLGGTVEAWGWGEKEESGQQEKRFEISNQHTVHLKLTQCYVSIISQ